MRRLFGVLLLAGLAWGSWLDRPVDEPPLRLGGYHVLQADFHVHSFLGDGVLSPFNVVLEARRRGLDALALTNHNQLIAARLARWFARRIDGPIVLVGQEITAPGFHYAAAGLERKVDWRQTAREVLTEVHAQGGVVIAAHPVPAFWPALDDVAAELDGAELMHPLVYVDEEGKQALREFFNRARAVNPDIAAIGSSDFHALQSLGLCRTLVFAERRDGQAVLDAIRAGRTLVIDDRGIPRGDAALIRLFGGRPSRHGRPEPAVSAAGAIAWLGLLGWLWTERRRV